MAERAASYVHTIEWVWSTNLLWYPQWLPEATVSGAVRWAVKAVLASLSGVERFDRPGIQVLLEPNLLSAAGPDRGITTYPTLVRAAAD